MSQHQSVLTIEKATPAAEVGSGPAQTGEVHALRAPVAVPG